jgi:UDP-N-acetylmuramyl pentapeptide phosphotransferase/UDP-N-acetylglucosamine-1-phosphate transferase
MSVALPVLLSVAVALPTSAVVAEVFRRWAIRRELLDRPNARSSHVLPRPRGGGVGIVTGFLAGLAVWLLAGGVASPRAAGGLVGALLIAGVSFVDDLRPLPPWPRLAVHALAAGLLTAAGVQGGDVPLALTVPVAFAWVVLLTNVYNFMDGIDGLAAVQAIVAGTAFGLAGAIVRNQLVEVVGPLLAAAAAGFLVHNLPPARLFMGDVGSTFLGFSFAGLSLLPNLGVGGERLPALFGVAVLAPFLFDALVTLGRRVLQRERWYEAHRSHYYQRLVAAGLGHGQVTLGYAGLAVVAAGAALCSLLVEPPLAQLCVALAYLPMLAVVAAAWRLERAPRPTVPYVSHQS